MASSVGRENAVKHMCDQLVEIAEWYDPDCTDMCNCVPDYICEACRTRDALLDARSTIIVLNKVVDRLKDAMLSIRKELKADE